MSDRFLFWAPTLIWATTWHVILYQLGDVPALYSVAMRFALASAILFVIAHWRGEAFVPTPRLHGALLLTGVVQYGMNYLATYEAERHVASGLMAVLFSLMIFTNAAGDALFFGRSIARSFWLAGVAGVCGVALIFWPDVASASAKPGALLGVGLGLTAICLASTGNMLTVRLTRKGHALVPLLAWSMGYGALFLMLAGQVSGTPFVLDMRPAYWVSMVYLSVFGSVTAFLMYFKLAQRQGPARASLMGMVIPVLALLISIAFEGWQPSWLALCGVVMCLSALWSATRPARPSTPA